MIKDEMADVISGMLATILTSTDFRLKKSDDTFVRKLPYGKQILGIPLWDYSPAYVFSLNICMRLDAVEEIFHRFSGAPAKYHSMSYTSIIRLSHFTKGSTEFRVNTAEDVFCTKAYLSEIIQNGILPFFDRCRDVESLNQVVNFDHPGIDITQNPSGAMHAVILAHLAGGVGLDKVVDRHQNAMELDPKSVHPFNRLVEYLKTH